MKKIFFMILFISFIMLPVNAKNSDKFDVNSDSFIELGHHAEKQGKNKTDDKVREAENFEDTAIDDVAKRYEKCAVELNLNDINDEALDIVNRGRIYKIEINKTQYRDSSKYFTNAFLNNSGHHAPLPSVINSSRKTAKVSPCISASIGQTNLYDAAGPSALFIGENESIYNTGSVITYKDKFFNLSTGTFNSSYNASSGGTVISSKSINLPKNAGSFILGGGIFKNDIQGNNKTTGGSFLEYKYKRLKLGFQISQNKYSNSGKYETGLYFVPEYQLSDTLYLKTKFIRNTTQDNMQDELALIYKPKFSKNNLEFEIDTSNQYNHNTIKQKIKFSISFRI